MAFRMSFEFRPTASSRNHLLLNSPKYLRPQLLPFDRLTNAPGLEYPGLEYPGVEYSRNEGESKREIVSSLESAVPRNAPVTLSESALPKSLNLKSSRIRTSKKRAGGELLTRMANRGDRFTFEEFDVSSDAECF